MRNKSFEEFESLFERASIPVFNLQRIVPSSIGLALTGTDLDSSLLSLVESLAQQYRASASVCWPEQLDEERARSLARKHKLEPCCAFIGHQQLGQHFNEIDVQLAVVGITPELAGAEGAIDSLVYGCDAPVLLIRNPISEPDALFGNILHSLTGDLSEIRHLTYSFSLVARRGRLMLLHTVNESELDDVRNTLRVSPGVTAAGGKQLLRDLSGHAERYLKGMVAASHDESYTVGYRLAVGDVLDVVRFELAEGSYSLLVVGTHDEGRSNLDSEEYRLIHLINDTPVLAL